MAVLPTGIGPVTGYQIERSLRFNSADSAYLSRTFGSPTNAKKWTYSLWVKGSPWTNAKLLAVCTSGSSDAQIYLTGGQLQISSYNGAGTDYTVRTDAVYRDPSSWYHFVFVYDTDNGTSANRAIIYVNGVRQSVTTPNNGMFPSGYSHLFNTNGAVTFIGARPTFFDGYLDGYLTEINFIDGQALTPSSFGETDSNTGVWKPKAFSGTYGTNGFYLKFADNSGTTSTTLGKDSSGNGNNWTPNNFSVTAGAGNDSLVDSPTSYGTDTGIGGEVRGNYATFNPLFRHPSTTWVTTYSEGNLKSSTSNAGVSGAISNIAPTSGKWYCEITCTAVGSATPEVDISTTNSPDQMNTSGEYVPGNYSYGVYYNSAGTRRTNNTATASWGSTWTTNDVLMLAGDCDTGKVWFGKNGTWQASGNPASGTNQAATLTTATPMWFGCGAANGAAFVANFGQRAFAYTAPSGFKALCTQNLPTPTIGATSTTQANDYFNAVLYSGNSSTQAITGVGFQPDFVWCKGRSTGGHHIVTDAVRTAAKVLSTSQTAAESAWSDNGFFQSLNSDGFTLTGGGTGINTTGNTYVAWNWKANGAGGSNTAGTITSTVSANTTSGFSIVTYTGNGTNNATVGHGLGVVPSMIILKNRSGSYDWPCYHISIGSGGYIYLNQTAAKATDANMWKTTPTSTVFTLGTYTENNGNTNTYVAYCFAPVAGYSAFGSYTGNGSATDGVFVYTGFRPRWILVKNSGAVGSWCIYDAVRNAYNLSDARLNTDNSNAEAVSSTQAMDIVSNGFKLKSSNTDQNGSSNTYIYAAFAESPFKYALAR